MVYMAGAFGSDQRVCVTGPIGGFASHAEEFQFLLIEQNDRPFGGGSRNLRLVGREAFGGGTRGRCFVASLLSDASLASQANDCSDTAQQQVTVAQEGATIVKGFAQALGGVVALHGREDPFVWIGRSTLCGKGLWLFVLLY